MTDATIINLSQISKDVQAILYQGVLDALEQSGAFRDFLTFKPRISIPNTYYLELAFDVPGTIEPDACKKIFTPELFIFEESSATAKDGPEHILGLRLPLNVPAEKAPSLTTIIKERVSNAISEELNPIHSLIDQYTQEAHSGFKHVFETLFGKPST